MMTDTLNPFLRQGWIAPAAMGWALSGLVGLEPEAYRGLTQRVFSISAFGWFIQAAWPGTLVGSEAEALA